MMASSSGFRNLLSEKEEATTQPRDGIQTSKQSIRPQGAVASRTWCLDRHG